MYVPFRAFDVLVRILQDRSSSVLEHGDRPTDLSTLLLRIDLVRRLIFKLPVDLLQLLLKRWDGTLYFLQGQLLRISSALRNLWICLLELFSALHRPACAARLLPDVLGADSQSQHATARARLRPP